MSARTKKIAISLPAGVLTEIDKAASERGQSRSAFIAQVMSRVSRLRQEQRITREINLLFEDPIIAEEQKAFAGSVAEAGGLEW